MLVEENLPFIEYKFEKLSVEESTQRSKEFYQFMDKRRTVRDISSEELPIELLENLILTAGTAPSGANIQPWKFVLVTDPVLKAKIREESEKLEERSYQELFSKQKKDDIAFTGNDWKKPFLTEAPALIVIFKEKYRIGDDGQNIPNYYPNESIGLAMGMLFTAIHNAGLVTIPYTPHPINMLKKLLNRPDNESAVMLLPLGYAKEGALIPDKKRKDLDEILVRAEARS